MAHEAQHERVELDGADLAAARRERDEHVGAAARADHQRVRVGHELERQGAIPGAHVAHAVEVAVPFEDARPGVGVDVQPREIRRRKPFDGVDARVCVPTGLRDARRRELVHLPAHGFERAGGDAEEARGLVGDREDGDQDRRRRRRRPRIGVRTDRQAAATNGASAATSTAVSPPSPCSSHVTIKRAERGAEQIGEVQRAAAIAPEVEHHRERDPGDEERHERRDEVERQPFEREREAHDQAQTGRNRQAIHDRPAPAALSSVGVSQRPFVRCSAKPPRPQPSSATETATNAKWYQIVAE